MLKQWSSRDLFLNHYSFWSISMTYLMALTSNPKLFSDGTSLFSVVQNINSAANNLDRKLMKISDWAFQWKVRFNPEARIQVQEVIFSRKINKIDHPPLYFNQSLIKSSSLHHLQHLCTSPQTSECLTWNIYLELFSIHF